MSPGRDPLRNSTLSQTGKESQLSQMHLMSSDSSSMSMLRRSSHPYITDWHPEQNRNLRLLPNLQTLHIST